MTNPHLDSNPPQFEGSKFSAGQPSVLRRFFGHLLVMPRWHKRVLALALVLGSAGLAGHCIAWFSPAPAAAPTASESNASESRAKGVRLVDDNTSAVPDKDVAQPSWLVRNSPWLTRIGVGCIGGFIVGWLFRAFIKLMSTLTLAGVVLFAGLSYFRVMNIDFTSAKEKYNSSISWITDQAGRVKDSVLAHIPGSASGLTGMFLGFRRRK